jgi:hypothetical protein
MKKIFTGIMLAFLTSTILKAQDNADKEAVYIKTLTERAGKILNPIQLTDSAQYKKVRGVIVAQYRNLSAVHEEKKIKLLAEKEKNESDKSVRDANLKAIDESTNAKLLVLHKDYINKLSASLTKEQVDLVKNGMTYDVLNVTYKAYQDMIPSLKTKEKEQILTWLTEARELAMDAGTSDGKHQIFGKYKGRINNYLSAAGYDLQKERKDWEERLKTAKSNGR